MGFLHQIILLVFLLSNHLNHHLTHIQISQITHQTKSMFLQRKGVGIHSVDSSSFVSLVVSAIGCTRGDHNLTTPGSVQLELGYEISTHLNSTTTMMELEDQKCTKVSL